MFFSMLEWFVALLGLSGIKKMCVVSVVAPTVWHYGLRSMPQCQIKGLCMMALFRAMACSHRSDYRYPAAYDTRLSMGSRWQQLCSIEIEGAEAQAPLLRAQLMDLGCASDCGDSGDCLPLRSQLLVHLTGWQR